MSYANYLYIAIRAAVDAGKSIMDIYNDPESDFGIERKADNSPLTKADKAAHRLITNALSVTPFPVLSEEGKEIPFKERSKWETLWIVDPLDGTKEFIKKNGEFTVNIALVKEGVPVLGVIYVPVRKELYFAADSLGAFKLAEMKHHGQLLRMTPQESDKVAAYLYQKFENDDDLIRVLFLALPDNLQFNFVKRMEKKSPAYFCCRDMQVIHSDAALQRLLTRFNDPEGWSNLAKNQYLSTSMKQKIWQRALSHRKNNPKADSAAYETSADMILSELISHGEVDDQMLLNATALIRLEDWDFLESALVSWDNLPAVVLKELQQNTPRNDIWAKFFLRQENSSRAQVDEALRVYYALDPDALAQLDVLAKQPDRIWWSTLAKSNLTFFKFGALNNRHTPPAVLAAEIDPEWWIVAMNNPRFPVDVLKARLKRDPLLALELVNPELDLVRQLALNGKTRAIREQAMRKLDELY